MKNPFTAVASKTMFWDLYSRLMLAGFEQADARTLASHIVYNTGYECENCE